MTIWLWVWHGGIRILNPEIWDLWNIGGILDQRPRWVAAHVVKTRRCTLTLDWLVEGPTNPPRPKLTTELVTTSRFYHAPSNCKCPRSKWKWNLILKRERGTQNAAIWHHVAAFYSMSKFSSLSFQVLSPQLVNRNCFLFFSFPHMVCWDPWW